MIVTLFTAGLLLLPSANAFWRLPCSQPVLNARVDPIVAPGGPSGHSHTVMGSNAIGFNTTFEDLRNSNCSTCMVKDDKSAYWIPQLFYEHGNKSLEAVEHGGMLVYYIQRFANGETVEVIPDGLRILVGNPVLRSNPNNQESEAISWLCLNFSGPAVPQTPGLTNTNCPDGLRAQVFFPACWDGVNLDSPDHKSHMAFPSEIDNGQCPPSHPHHLISIFYEVWFYPKPFNQLNDGGRFVLSNGDPTGYGLHGDFMDGWDKSVLSRAVAQCTALSGVIEDCPVFNNENRFYTGDENNACFAPNPIPAEHDDPGHLMQYLPGCVAITDGPANATEGELAPGCVPGGGSGSAAAPAVPQAAPNNAPAMNPTVPATSNKMSPPSTSPSGSPAPTDNQLAASTTTMPASTFTTDLGAISTGNIVQGAASPSPSTNDDGSNSGQCKRAPEPDTAGSLSAYRRSRTHRRHRSRWSN